MKESLGVEPAEIGSVTPPLRPSSLLGRPTSSARQGLRGLTQGRGSGGPWARHLRGWAPGAAPPARPKSWELRPRLPSAGRGRQAAAAPIGGEGRRRPSGGPGPPARARPRRGRGREVGPAPARSSPLQFPARHRRGGARDQFFFFFSPLLCTLRHTLRRRRPSPLES